MFDYYDSEREKKKRILHSSNIYRILIELYTRLYHLKKKEYIYIYIHRAFEKIPCATRDLLAFFVP